MGNTASLAVDSANRKTGTMLASPTTTAVAPNSVTSALGTLVKLVPTDIVGMYVVVLTLLRTNEGVKGNPAWLWAWFTIAFFLTIVFFCLQFAQSYRQTRHTLPSWRDYPAWRILLTVLAFCVWAFAVEPNATEEMFADHSIASLLSTAGIIVVGPLLSAIDGFLNPN